jgi:hypothetical protein
MKSPFASLNWGVHNNNPHKYVVTTFQASYDGDLMGTNHLNLQNFKVFSNLSDAFLYFWRSFITSTLLEGLVDMSADMVEDGDLLDWTSLLQLTELHEDETWTESLSVPSHFSDDRVIYQIWESLNEVTQLEQNQGTRDVYSILYRMKQRTLSDDQTQLLDSLDSKIQKQSDIHIKNILTLCVLELRYWDSWEREGDTSYYTLQVMSNEYLHGASTD